MNWETFNNSTNYQDPEETARYAIRKLREREYIIEYSAQNVNGTYAPFTMLTMIKYPTFLAAHRELKRLRPTVKMKCTVKW